MESPSDSGVLPIDIDPVTGVLRARGGNPTNRRNFLAIVPAGAMALGAALLGMSSPGPNAQSFIDAYVRKHAPSSPQQIADAHGYWLYLQQLDNAAVDQEGKILQISGTGVLGDGVSIDFMANIPGIKLSVSPAPANNFIPIFQIASPTYGNLLPISYTDASSEPRIDFGTPFQVGDPRFNVIGFMISELSTASYLWQTEDALANIVTLLTLKNNALTLGTGIIPSPRAAGAQVGLPTGTVGTATADFCTGGHRHAFSGRFLGTQATYPISANAGLPINIARIKINSNWTLRRIWVYTNTGPTGGTETYALVNAAGAVQGTAVVLPAGPGVAQAESALQVTNLTGATLYYLAQTAVGAGWLAASGNVEVGFEYTMNV